MSTDLVAVENELMPAFGPVLPTFAQLLPPSIPPERLMRTIIVSCMQVPKLLQCNRQSLVNAALSAACLGLECDGVSGQGYLLPFKGRAQFLTGYKGYQILAARSSWSIEGFVVREGDEFAFDEGHGTWSHARRLGGEGERRLIAAYAVARRPGHADRLRVVSDDEVRAVRDRSPGGGKGPWTTDYAAMARKTAIRRLAQDIPLLSLQQATALDTQHEIGNGATLDPAGGGVQVYVDKAAARAPTPGPEVLEGEVVSSTPSAGGEGSEAEPWVITFQAGRVRTYASLPEYAAKLRSAISHAGRHLAAFRAANESFILGPVAAEDEHLASMLIDSFVAAEPVERGCK